MDHLPRWLLLFFLMVVPFTMLFSQQERMAVITGQVRDAETATSLENAIVFLSNTPIGTSTGKDGKFVLVNIPLGEYELISSLIGYERQTLSLRLEKPESLYYDINLKPQPIQTKGVEVIGEHAEGAKRELGLFFPGGNDDAYCVYGTVSSLPIGVLFTDSAIYMYCLDTAVVDSEKYIRLWLLYKNLSETPYDFNPMKCLHLHLKGKKYTIQEIFPSLPGIIIPAIDTQKIASRIFETVGVTLEALAIKQSAFEWEKYYSNLLLLFNRRPVVHKPSKFNPARDGSLSARLYSIFQSSINVGIMKRYIVYPENSVNGYIYFPFPGLNWKATGSWFGDAAKYVYELELLLPDGTKKIVFRPN